MWQYALACVYVNKCVKVLVQSRSYQVQGVIVAVKLEYEVVL